MKKKKLALKFKKALSLTLAATMLCSLAACGSTGTKSNQDDFKVTTEENTRMDEILIDNPEPQHVIADEVEIMDPVSADTGIYAITIDGVDYPITVSEGIQNLQNVENGIVYEVAQSGLQVLYAYYLPDGSEADSVPEEPELIMSKEHGWTFDTAQLPMITIRINSDYALTNGIHTGSSAQDLVSAGFVYCGRNVYRKYFDENGDIEISEIDDIYETLMGNGAEGLDLAFFPVDIALWSKLGNNREENEQILFDSIKNEDINKEAYIKYQLLGADLMQEMTGWAGNNVLGAPRKDYVGYYSVYLNESTGQAEYIEVRLIASPEQINQWYEKWGLPEEVWFAVD